MRTAKTYKFIHNESFHSQGRNLSNLSFKTQSKKLLSSINVFVVPAPKESSFFHQRHQHLRRKPLSESESGSKEVEKLFMSLLWCNQHTGIYFTTYFCRGECEKILNHTKILFRTKELSKHVPGRDHCLNDVTLSVFQGMIYMRHSSVPFSGRQAVWQSLEHHTCIWTRQSRHRVQAFLETLSRQDTTSTNHG